MWGQKGLSPAYGGSTAACSILGHVEDPGLQPGPLGSALISTPLPLQLCILGSDVNNPATLSDKLVGACLTSLKAPSFFLSFLPYYPNSQAQIKCHLL